MWPMNSAPHLAAYSKLFFAPKRTHLGENARVVVDNYVFNPNKGSAKVVLSGPRHPFLGGPIEGKYGILLLNGRVKVSGR